MAFIAEIIPLSIKIMKKLSMTTVSLKFYQRDVPTFSISCLQQGKSETKQFFSISTLLIHPVSNYETRHLNARLEPFEGLSEDEGDARLVIFEFGAVFSPS